MVVVQPASQTILRVIDSVDELQHRINYPQQRWLGIFVLDIAMNTTTKRLLFWTPRLLCLLFAAFISIFALDVFGEHHGFWNITLALLMHLIPTALLLLILAVSWRWEWVGGVLFPALGFWYLVAGWGRFHWSVYVVIAGPLFLLGILFLLNWRHHLELHPKS